MVIQRSEHLAVVSLDANARTAKGSVLMTPGNMSFLKSLWNSFDRIRWESITIKWVSAVGTTYGGLIGYGCDYTCALKDKDLSRTTIAALTPNKSHAVWLANTMVVPKKMLQTRLWYLDEGDDIDKAPFKLVWAVDGTASGTASTVGEFWVTYKVILSGTRAS